MATIYLPGQTMPVPNMPGYFQIIGPDGNPGAPFQPATGTAPTSGAATGGSLDLGAPPAGTAATVNAETTRSNIIGDAFQNNYGNPNMAALTDLGAQAQAVGNATGTGFLDTGNANFAGSQAMADYANQTSGVYQGASALDYYNQGLAGAQAAGSIDQLGAMGGAAFNAAGQSGSQAQMDYLNQVASGNMQAQLGGNFGAAAGGSFDQANQMNAAAGGALTTAQNDQGYLTGLGNQMSGLAQGNFTTADAMNQVAGQDYNAQGALGGSQIGLAGQFASGSNAFNQGAAQDYQSQQALQAGQVGNALTSRVLSSGDVGKSNTSFGNAQQDWNQQGWTAGQSMDALSQLRGFYQQGPGPSAAEAQLAQSTDQNMSSAIALARSGRGAGDNATAMRQAMFSNAATQQQAGMQMAQLRAQESDAWRQRQLSAMGMEQGTLGTMRGQDISAMQGNLGAAQGFGQMAYQGQGLAQQGLQNARTGDLAAMQAELGAGQAYAGQAGQMLSSARGMDLQSMQNMLASGQAYTGLGYQATGQEGNLFTGAGGQSLQALQSLLGAGGTAAGQGYQGLSLQQQMAQAMRGQDITSMQANLSAQQGLAQLGIQGTQGALTGQEQLQQAALQAMAQNNQYGLGYAQLGNAYTGLGLQNQVANEQLANQQFLSGAQLQNAYTTTGLQNQLNFAQLANQQYMTADQLNAQMLNAQLQANTAQYGADRGVQVGMAQIQQQQQAAQMAQYSALAAGALSLISDIRAKKNISKRKPVGLLEKVFGLADHGHGDGDGSDDADDAPAKPGASGRPPQTWFGDAFDPNRPQWDIDRARNDYSQYGPQAAPPAAQYNYAALPDLAKQLQAEANGQRIDPATGAILPSPYASPRNEDDSDALLSDERGKFDLRPAQGYSYDYKDPDAPGAAHGRQYGPMAQDLEKTPAGASVVKTGADGMKSIDTARLTMVNTAALSEQQRRLDELERIARSGRRAS